MLKIWLLYHYVQTNQTCQKKQKCKLIIIITYIHCKIEHICKKSKIFSLRHFIKHLKCILNY